MTLVNADVYEKYELPCRGNMSVYQMQSSSIVMASLSFRRNDVSDLSFLDAKSQKRLILTRDTYPFKQ